MVRGGMLSTLFSSATKRARVDFAETFATIDTLLYERGLRAAPMSSELAVARGRFGVTMAAKAFEGDRVLRLVVTHVSAAPLFAGLSIVGHPRPEVDAPLLLADVRVIPSGVTNAFFDACGPGSGPGCSAPSDFGVLPTLAVGARIHLGENASFTARLGYPTITFGVSFL